MQPVLSPFPKNSEPEIVMRQYSPQNIDIILRACECVWQSNVHVRVIHHEELCEPGINYS